MALLIAPPKVWTDIAKNHANYEDLRRVIARHVAETANQMCMEIYTFQFTDDMLKDTLKLDVAPGGALPVWSNLQQGMCIVNSLPTSAIQGAEYQSTEKNYRDTVGMRTFKESQRKIKGEPHMSF